MELKQPNNTFINEIGGDIYKESQLFIPSNCLYSADIDNTLPAIHQIGNTWFKAFIDLQSCLDKANKDQIWIIKLN